MDIRSNVRKGSDVINLIKLGIKDIMIYLGVIKIYPIIPINNAVVTCDSAVYNRNNQVAQNIVVTLNGTTLVEYRDYVVSANAGGTNVGTYTVTVKGIDNYGGTVNGTFTITKATPTYTAPTTKTLTYTGSPQALLNGGYSSDGIIQYSTDNSTWSASIPTGTNVNTYTTYWRFIGDGGNFYDKSSESISTTILKADQAAPIAIGATTIYNNPAVATASGGGGHGTLEWTNGTTQSSIGSKTTKARWSGDSNYNASPYSNEVTVIMNKMAGVVTINGISTSYDGNSKILATVSNNSGTMHYSTDQTNWSTSIPTSINAGSWNIYWYMDGTDYYQGIEASSSRYVSSSIAKINQAAPTATGAAVTYGNTATATATGGGGYGTLEWSNGNTLTGNVGSKTTKARWSGNTNYNPSDYSNEVTLAITKVNLSNPSVSMSNWTYGSTASTPSVSGNSGNGTITYSYKVSGAADSTYSSTKPSNVGTYVVRAVIAETTNYNGTTVTNTFTITKANQSAPTAYGDSVNYGSTAIASASGGGGHGSLEWSNGNTRSAIGSQSTSARWSGDNNYNASGWSNEVSLIVNKSSQSAPTAYGDTVTEGSTATATASGGGGYGSLEWSNGNTRTAVGSQTTKARWSGDSSHDASPWSNEVTLTVEAAVSEPNYIKTHVSNNTGKTSPAVYAYDSSGNQLFVICVRTNGNQDYTMELLQSGTVSKIQVSQNNDYINYISLIHRGQSVVNKYNIGSTAFVSAISLSSTFHTDDYINNNYILSVSFSDT